MKKIKENWIDALILVMINYMFPIIAILMLFGMIIGVLFLLKTLVKFLIS